MSAMVVEIFVSLLRVRPATAKQMALCSFALSAGRVRRVEANFPSNKNKNRVKDDGRNLDFL